MLLGTSHLADTALILAAVGTSLGGWAAFVTASRSTSHDISGWWARRREMRFVVLARKLDAYHVEQQRRLDELDHKVSRNGGDSDNLGDRVWRLEQGQQQVLDRIGDLETAIVGQHAAEHGGMAASRPWRPGDPERRHP